MHPTQRLGSFQTACALRFCSIQIFSEVRTKFQNSYVLRDAVGVGNTPPFAANDGQAGLSRLRGDLLVLGTAINGP
jgi:hypothetical protein